MAYNFPQELVKIGATQTASASSTISFTTGINSNFNTYLVKIRNMRPNTNDITLRMVFSTDGGANYLNSNYKYTLRYFSDAATVASSASTTSIDVIDSPSSTASRAANMDITLYNLGDSTRVKSCYMHGALFTADNKEVIQFGYGMNTTTTAVNAIRFLMSSSTITSGTFEIFGVVEP